MANQVAVGVLGNGLKVAYSAASPLTWVQVPDILMIDKFFGLVNPKIDISVSGDLIKRTMPGVPDAPELGFTKLADPDPSTGIAEEAIRAFQLAGTTIYWRFERPTNRARTSFRGEVFQAYVLSVEPAAPIQDKQTVKITLSYGGNYQIDGSVGASQIS